MPIVQTPLPTITLMPDGRIEMRNAEGTGLLFAPDEDTFDDDDAEELVHNTKAYLYELGLRTLADYFDPANTAARAQYEARGSVNVRRGPP